MPDWQTDVRTTRYTVVRRPLPPLRFELHPFVAAGIAVFALALLGWAGATTTYALFRDEFLMQIVSRHTAEEKDSKAEIARLRAEIERERSRILVERESFLSKFDVLSRRQIEVERRQQVLSKFGSSGSGDAELRRRPAGWSESRLRADSAFPELNARYDAIEQRQNAAMTALQDKLDSRKKDLRQVYAKLGLKPRLEPVKAGLGGLYIPLNFGRTDAVTRSVERIEESSAEVRRLSDGLAEIPVRSPYPGAAIVSPFGSRSDPFLGTLAFHSGVDLDVDAGEPARATAGGTVVSAGWNGGYGLMVEVKHAEGYSTRYAHLSAVSVSEGQQVAAGDAVGRVGSTGRSTGPHLHYETRINDNPVDPRRFLAAGALLSD